MRRSQRVMTTLLATAMVVSPAGSATQTTDRAPRDTSAMRDGFCRTPAPLARLAPEPARQQRPDRHPSRHRDEDVAVTEEEASVSVTGSRATAPAMGSPTPVTVVTSEELGSGPPPPPPPAPPPPPVVAPAPSPSVGAASSADAKRMSPGPGMPTPHWPREPGPREPAPREGLLTAGEHDDLLNPELYARYVARSDLGQKIRDLPRVDTARTLTVRVTDRAGQPVPFATVAVTCSDGNVLRLDTVADGTVVLFPALDRLSRDITVAVHDGRRRASDTKRFVVTDGPGQASLGLIVDRPASRPRALDLMLAIDTTGSMGDEIRYLQTELDGILRDVKARYRDLDLRVGFVFYRDEGDDYVTRTVPLSADFTAGRAALARETAGGGGDYPEAMDQALNRAVSAEWRADAVRTLLLVADAPPHDERFGATWHAAEAARFRRIHIVPVAASGVAGEAEYAMRAMAAATQAPYIFLTDDSGVGNPHATPDVVCYRVTRLSGAIRRAIESQVTGRRVEADPQDVIRTVGDYDAGKCRLPSGWDWRRQPA